MAKKNKKRSTIEILTRKESAREASRYLSNAKEILQNNTSIQDDRYMDRKYVREASGMAYLAAIIPIKSYLYEHGIITDKRKLPKSQDQFTMFIKKIPRNGKLMNHYNTVYENLHVAGYYEGYCNVQMIKSGFQSAQKIIDILSQ